VKTPNFKGVLAVLRAIFYLWHPHAMNWRIVIVVAAIGLASMVVVSGVGSDLPGQSIQRLAGVLNFAQGVFGGEPNLSAGDISTEARSALFSLAGSLFQGGPILGVGTSGFEALAPRFLSASVVEVYPHNLVLQFAAEFGLVGIALLAGLVLLPLAAFALALGGASRSSPSLRTAAPVPSSERQAPARSWEDSAERAAQPPFLCQL